GTHSTAGRFTQNFTTSATGTVMGVADSLSALLAADPALRPLCVRPPLLFDRCFERLYVRIGEPHLPKKRLILVPAVVVRAARGKEAVPFGHREVPLDHFRCVFRIKHFDAL